MSACSERSHVSCLVPGDSTNTSFRKSLGFTKPQSLALGTTVNSWSSDFIQRLLKSHHEQMLNDIGADVHRHRQQRTLRHQCGHQTQALCCQWGYLTRLMQTMLPVSLLIRTKNTFKYDSIASIPRCCWIIDVPKLTRRFICIVSGDAVTCSDSMVPVYETSKE